MDDLAEVSSVLSRHFDFVEVAVPLLDETLDLVRDELRVRETPSLNRVKENLCEIVRSLIGSVTMEGPAD